MKYHVTRTSEYDQEVKPCDEAFAREYIHIDERTTDDPAKNRFLADWYDHGTNHRVENGHIKRDFVDHGWFVDIATTDELNAFVQKYGDVVVGVDYENPEQMRIEIYDGYRE